jgi:hypothetical protein
VNSFSDQKWFQNRARAAWRTTRLRTVRSTGARARQGGAKEDASERSDASHASGVGLTGPRERACRGVRGAKPLGVINAKAGPVAGLNEAAPVVGMMQRGVS